MHQAERWPGNFLRLAAMDADLLAGLLRESSQPSSSSVMSPASGRELTSAEPKARASEQRLGAVSRSRELDERSADREAH